MKILFDNFYAELNKHNRLFTDDNALIGDNLLTPIKVLGETARKRGLEVGTSYVIKKESADVIIFLDYPSAKNENLEYGLKHHIPMFLIILESPIVKPEVFQIALHKPFIKVFTWSDKLIASDSNKNIKINYSYNITSDFEIGRRNKNLVIISGNKVSNHPQEIYSERLAVINWYEKHFNNELDLFGLDWDIKIMRNSLFGIFFNKINRSFKLFKTGHKTYKGKILRKSEILKKYNFSLCFENARDFSGYITEKIFDSMMAGCIPIYRGADNIMSYIPSNCFIDYRNFNSIEAMHSFLASLSDEDIKTYQSNIKNFLNGEAVKTFTIDCFVETVLGNVLNNVICS